MMTRTSRNILIAVATAGLSVAAMLLAPAGQDLDRLSFATSWLCLLYFAAALLVGPLNVRRTGRLPGNSLLRRDLGIWTALTGLVHLALAFKVSMNQSYMQLYIYGADAWPEPEVRQLIYRWAVLASLAIAALFVVLLALSNNLAIRVLGARWWKRLQRLSYPAFALTVAHSVAFQLIEARTPSLVAALVLITALVVAAQYTGWSRLRSGRTYH